MLQGFDILEIRYVFQKGNQTVDWVASMGHLVSSSMDIVSNRYLRLQKILLHDVVLATSIILFSLPLK